MGLNINYRPALDSDKSFLLELRSKTMDPHLVASSLPVSEEAHLSRINYKFDQAYIIELDMVAIGLLKADRKIDDIEIIQIQIAPEYQNKGIGRSVLQAVIQEATASNQSVSLSVLKVNRAQELYISLGFKTVAEDESSYLMQYGPAGMSL
ncbi:MAG: GNAT family N-acetyltransferase [Sphingobacterium sp.]|jgi:ribosomal protein S18 acetylase RimI-like enzyme|nr:GNAT family N-acetyltransferase [Sphingobacterium sp.]